MILLLTTALAETLVISDAPSPRTARAEVARTLGIPKDQMTVTSPAELLPPTSPILTFGAPFEQCAPSAPRLSNEDIRTTLTSVQDRVIHGQYGEVDAALDALLLRVPCLREPVDATLLARVYYLRGATGYMLSPDLTPLYFKTALNLQPELRWDDAFSENNGMIQFATLQSERRASGTLRILSADTVDVRMDGRPSTSAAQAVTDARHLVQLVSRGTSPTVLGTLVVDVTPDQPVTLLFPPDASPHLLDWVFAPLTRSASAQAMSLVRPEDGTLVALSGGKLARYNAASVDWDITPVRRYPRALGVSLVAGGVAIGAAGAALASLGYSHAQDAFHRGQAPSSLAEQESAAADYVQGERQLALWSIVGATGGIAATVGLTVEVGEHRRARAAE